MAIGANVSEAQHAESRSDFIHKMKIASKEASETLYWLSICEKMNNFGFQHDLVDELKQMIAIISKIIISAKKTFDIQLDISFPHPHIFHTPSFYFGG